jgi:type IV secretory pathway component VirB8
VHRKNILIYIQQYAKREIYNISIQSKKNPNLTPIPIT